MTKAWGGRFSAATDPDVERFTESISFDARLAAVDVAGSTAHAKMLCDVGLITADERDAIVGELAKIAGEFERGEIATSYALEDVHMHIESTLIDRIGDAGRKLHTARSRNDQVSTDLRLYVREAIDHIAGLLRSLQSAFVGRAETDIGVVVPGYTHLQRAQPVQVVHYWMAYVEKFERDRRRLLDCRTRVNQSPLGGAALAGTSLPIDRNATAEALGFEQVMANSLDISSDRDFLFEFAAALSLVATHLSGWCEEWILWFSTEFGFLKLPDAYTTGSSIMPQKRNPDVLELIRGKAAGIMAAVPQLQLLTKNLPLAYNRDLQEDKRPVFRAIDETIGSLELAVELVRRAELVPERIAGRIEEGFLDATALMEDLIRRGVPMRTGHGVVGRLVSLAESRGQTLSDLSLEDFAEAVGEEHAHRVDGSIFDVLGTANANAALVSYGSGGRDAVEAQVAAWRQRLAGS